MFKLWLQASRPKTLAAALSPIVVGALLSLSVGPLHTWSMVFALISAIFIQIGANFANDYFDNENGADTDQRLGPVRATASGLISPRGMKWAMILSFALAFVAGLGVMLRGGWPIFWIGVASIISGILYTGGPRPLGYIGLGDLFVLIFFGPVAVGGIYYINTLSIQSDVLVLGLGPGLIATALLCVNNLRDVDEDSQTGKRTLAVRFGKSFVKWEYIFCIVLAALLPVIYGQRFISFPYSLGFLALILFSLSSFRLMFNGKGSALNAGLEKTGTLLILYALLYAILV